MEADARSRLDLNCSDLMPDWMNASGGLSGNWSSWTRWWFWSKRYGAHSSICVSLSLSFFFLEWFVIGRIIFFFSFFLFIMLPLLLGLRWRDKAMTMITILLPFHLDGQQLRRSFLPPVAFSFSFYFLFCFLSSIWWIPIGYRPSPHIYSRSRYVYRYDMLIDSNLPVQRHLLPRASIPDSGLWLVHDHLQFQHILFIFIFNVDLY